MRLKLSIGVGKKQAGAAQTYIGLVGDAVVGYYTLTVGQVTREEAPERLTKGLARHPVPIMLLARLAVAVSSQGQGVGKALLRDAMQRAVQAADIAGIRAFAVHAKDHFRAVSRAVAVKASDNRRRAGPNRVWHL